MRAWIGTADRVDQQLGSNDACHLDRNPDWTDLRFDFAVHPLFLFAFLRRDASILRVPAQRRGV